MPGFFKRGAQHNTSSAAKPPETAKTIPSSCENPAFPDLTSHELDALFNLGQVYAIEVGQRLSEVLPTGMPSSGCIYLVLKGRLELCDPSGTIFATLGPGDYIDPRDLNQGSAGSSPHDSCQPSATHACSLLELATDTLVQLDPARYEKLDRHLSQKRQHLLENLFQRTQSVARQNRLLSEALWQSRTHEDQSFVKSDLVQQVVRGVPRLPVSTVTLLNKLLDEKSTHSEILELVKSDPGLTGTLLKAVNSPVYAFANKIGNVHHAITLLGFDAVHQLVLSESLRKSLPANPEFMVMHLRSLEISHIAFSIASCTNIYKPASSTNIYKPAEAATAGILCQVGDVVVELLKAQNPRLADLLKSINTNALGAELLRNWNLPEPLCQAVAYQDYPEFAAPNRIPEAILPGAAILHWATRCQQWLRGNMPAASSSPFAEAYLQALGIVETDEHSLYLGRVLQNLRSRAGVLPKSLQNAVHAKVD